MSQKTLLPNGVRIVSKKVPHVHSVSMGVWVNVGARDETDDQSGLSHFIEHMIFKGTTRRCAYQIAKEFDAIGGHTNAFTSMENTCYHARVMDAHLATMTDILSDIFLNSVFDPAEVERERPVILQEIGMVEDTPEEVVHQLSADNYYGGHPLGRSILGSRENILCFDADNIRSFFNRLYHPERIVIALAGNVDHEHMVDLLAPTFSAIKLGDPLPARTVPNFRPGLKIQNRALEQVHICLATPGMAITDRRRFTFSLLNTIMGGNMSSRLFQVIREQNGLAYAIYSFITSHVDSGMFGVYAGVQEENVRRTIELIQQTLHQMRTTPIEADVLQDAKEYTKGNLYLAAESVDNQMVRVAQNEIHFETHIPLADVVNKIEAVGVEEIQELARLLFDPKQMSLTLLGPIDATTNLQDLLADGNF